VQTLSSALVCRLYEGLELLTVRERQVMTLRFGLLDEQDHTLEEVSHTLQVTCERVHHLEERAWNKLKKAVPDGEAGTFVVN